MPAWSCYVYGMNVTRMGAFNVGNIFLARKYWAGEATMEQEQPHWWFCMFSCVRTRVVYIRLECHLLFNDRNHQI